MVAWGAHISQLYTLKVPFDPGANSIGQLSKLVAKASYDEEPLRQRCGATSDLVKALLHRRPEDRMSLLHLIDRLETLAATRAPAPCTDDSAPVESPITR